MLKKVLVYFVHMGYLYAECDQRTTKMRALHLLLVLRESMPLVLQEENYIW